MARAGSNDVRAVAILHVQNSIYGAVRMGYGRIQDAVARGGGTLKILTPEAFPRLSRLHGRWLVLLYPVAAAWWLWRRRGQYDVALFHSYAGWVFNLARFGVPTITAFHGIEPLEFRELAAQQRARGARLSRRYRLVHGVLMDWMLRGTCQRSARVTCLNSEEQRFLLDQQWTTADRLVLLQHGVPDMFFTTGRVFAPRARRLLVVSQWVDRKSPADIVSVFSALARRRPDLELWCYGTRAAEAAVLGAFPADLRARVRHRADLTQGELAEAFRDADVFLHASLNEAYGRAIAEAMASALPIVTTPVGVALDRLRDGRDCLMAPKASPAALEAAVERLLDDAALRQRLGQAAQHAAASLRAADRDLVVADLLTSVGASN